jgi:hypothetical protein
MENTETDRATLALFSNPAYLNLLKKRQLTSLKENHSPDIKFYRKRIISLFKTILKGEEIECISELKEIHSTFVLTAINYFKMIDTKDLIQTQYADKDANMGENTCVMIDPYMTDVDIGEDEGDVDLSNGNISNGNISNDNISFDKADEYMMRKTVHVANLDNYIINVHDNSANDVRVIPIKMEYDLKAPEFRTKGVKHKQKKEKKDEI